ncbi:MAG: hypothetical protein JXA73_03490 [Acidobacteria bacterium]|nr:hypothetical protein [Acidobacteriota bacterium]
MKKPAVPLILTEFAKQEKEVALNLGMPGLRIQYFRGPVWAKTNEQIRKQIVEGNNPITGKPVMKELVENLTKPLTAEEKKTGVVKKDMGPATYTGTPDELQKLFLEKRYTDFLPVVLPTEDKVNEMLKATSHDPDEVLGKMNPGSEAGENWTYTVKVAAINAVMAGAKPEYFPVILALGSTGQTAVNVSDNGFMAGAVINGKIRDEIGLNYEEGAVGPYAHANTTIGRAWSLLSINGGNCGKVGTTYMGTIGNPMNLIGIIMAENELRSPFKPLSVRRGFKEGENIVTLFMGWGILSAKNWAATAWGPNMDYPGIIKEIYSTQDGWLFGTCAVLSPPIANFVKDAGYDTVEKLTEWVTGRPPGAKPAMGGNLNSGTRSAGGTFTVVVTGGSNNNYFSMGGMVPSQSIQIDKWR